MIGSLADVVRDYHKTDGFKRDLNSVECGSPVEALGNAFVSGYVAAGADDQERERRKFMVPDEDERTGKRIRKLDIVRYWPDGTNTIYDLRGYEDSYVTPLSIEEFERRLFGS
jgi:hypothetical protein